MLQAKKLIGTIIDPEQSSEMTSSVISALKGATHPTKKRRNYEFLVSDSDIMPTVF
jgi:hypothetical protein